MQQPMGLREGLRFGIPRALSSLLIKLQEIDSRGVLPTFRLLVECIPDAGSVIHFRRIARSDAFEE